MTVKLKLSCDWFNCKLLPRYILLAEHSTIYATNGLTLIQMRLLQIALFLTMMVCQLSLSSYEIKSDQKHSSAFGMPNPDDISEL